MRSVHLVPAALLLLVACASDVTRVEPGPPARWQNLNDLSTTLTLNALAMGSADQLVAVGNAGAVVQYDGTGWESIAPGNPVDFLDAHWLADGTLVVAANAPRLYVRTEGEWSTRPVFGIGGHSSLWASSVDDVYLAGSLGRLIHTTPAGSQRVTINGAELSGISHVWGTDANNVYAVGVAGLFHWDGTAWEEILLGIDDEFAAMDGLPSGEFFMVTRGRRLYYFTGEVFWIDDVDVPIVVTAGWIPAPGTVALLGKRGEVVHWENFAWTLTAGPEDATSCVAVARQADGTGLILEESSGTFAHRDGVTRFHSLVVPPRVTLLSLWGTSAQDLVATLQDGRFLHRTGGGWSIQRLVDFEPGKVFGTSRRQIVATGRNGLARYDGSVWTREDTPVIQYNAVHGSGPDHLVAVGAAGQVSIYDGSGWRTEQLDVTRALNAVWTSGRRDILVAAAPRAYAAQFDGSSWDELPGFDQLSGTLLAVWGAAAGPTAVMSNEAIYRFGMGGWEQIAPPGSTGYWGALGLDGSRLLLGRKDGQLLLHDGEALVPYDLPAPARAATVLAAWSDEGILLGGDRGLLWALAP